MSLFDPILLTFPYWEHDNIAQLVFENANKCEDGLFTGKFARLILKNDDLLFNIVGVVTDEIYEKLIVSKIDNELFNDILNEFFFSKKLDNTYLKHIDVNTNYTYCSISPDMCIHYDGINCGWSMDS